MNVYVVVEGKRAEKTIYKKWIPLINASLSYVDRLDSVLQNNFTIISGNGYPGYFEVIENAITDINNHGDIDRLLICIDSENMTYLEKYDEITDFVKNKHCIAQIKIVVQHFCFETWALGNRKIVSRSPQNAKLREYYNLFNVKVQDPALLPEYPKDGLNRSQFAYDYLRKMVQEKNPRLSYSKSSPGFIAHPTYLSHITSRFQDTGHIESFGELINALG